MLFFLTTIQFLIETDQLVSKNQSISPHYTYSNLVTPMTTALTPNAIFRVTRWCPIHCYPQ